MRDSGIIFLLKKIDTESILMVDNKGYRLNVGMIICNQNWQVLWARRYGRTDAWQFPQGGINFGERPRDAMYRELYEELGLQQKDVTIIAISKWWLRYTLPTRLIRYHVTPLCIGQKQKWFLLQLNSDEKNINFYRCKPPEFDTWCWVNYWYPIGKIVSFKRHVYQKVMKEFSAIIYERIFQQQAIHIEETTNIREKK